MKVSLKYMYMYTLISMEYFQSKRIKYCQQSSRFVMLLQKTSSTVRIVGSNEKSQKKCF